MKYYNVDGKAVVSMSGKPVEGCEEWTNPIKADGTLLAQHEGIALLPKDADGNPYKYYNQDGTPDTARVDSEATTTMIAHYKSLYTGIVNAKLKELDYDSLATVKLWEGDATFGVEASRILTWYKSIISKNYELLNAGVLLTDAEYLAEINAVQF